ncbi:hypothetical protein Tco_1250028 [Tanacetum coccineum]
MDEQTGQLNDLLDRFETLFETFSQQQAAVLLQQLDAFHVENARPVDAIKDTILSSALNAAPLKMVFAWPDDEESTSGKTIVDESIGIKQNEPMDFNEGKSLNLVVAANDVGGVAQVDTWNHNRSQPINTFEWGIDFVRCNLGEPNIVATYGNDMGITNYGPRLKDEAIK